MNKRVLKGKELVWYIIAAIFAIGGVSLAILSIIGDYLNVPAADNWIVNAEEAVSTWSKIEIDWLGWGTIFVTLAFLIAVITLLYFAKKDISEKEKALRRAQRLGGDVPSVEE
jgi:ABC-type Na+ efflux pump permease subunit